MNIGKCGLKRKLFVLFLPLFALGGCIKEKEITPEEREGLISFALDMPRAVSRSLSDTDENTVSQIDVLVFRSGGGTYFTTVSRTGAEIATDGVNSNKKSFTAKLRQGEYDLVIFANARDAIGTLSLVGMTKSEVLAALTEQLPGSGKWPADGSRPIPMWGDVGTLTISESSSLTDANAVAMTRMLARVDVGVTAAKFLLQSVHVYNYNTEGRVVPATSAWDAAGKVAKTPTVVAGTRVKGPVDYTADGASVQDIYLFEAANLTAGTAKQPSDRTCLVVGGLYDADGDGDFTNDGDPTYYRVDFSTGSGVTEAFKDVLRNHHYTVDITSVTQSGYATAEDAFVGGSQLTATVTEWNLATQSVIGDGQWWLTVSRDEIAYDYLGGEAEIIAQTNYDPTPLQGFPAGIRFDETEIEYTPEVVPGEEWITLSGGVDGDLQRTIKIAATQNPSAAGRAAKVNIRAGNFTKVVNVEQSGASFTFNVTGVTGEYTYAGGVKTFTVESHATATLSDGTSTTFAVPWTAQFSEDGENWSDEAPDWLIIPSGGAGSTTPATYNAETLAMEEVSNANAQDIQLRNNSTRGTAEAPYDLSTKGTGLLTDMNTANCYIVNGGGHYKLPLVYGNAIKGGATNTNAYSSAIVTTEPFLKQFLRHDDQPIIDPYIYNNGFTPVDAVLVWMDFPSLVVNVRLTDENRYLAFDIPASKMGQGNAIVAVRDADGTIMWSWHIWVTPLVDMDNPATDLVRNRTPKDYYFMQYNLGWCTGRDPIIYGIKPRSVQVQTMQSGTNMIQEFTLAQNNGSGQATEVNHPFWQWGRKDPLPPGTGIKAGDPDKIIYGSYAYTKIQGRTTIGAAVQNPHVFYPYNGNWISLGNYYNLWNAESTETTINDNPVKKTVYDPSPVGFAMPASASWTGFTTTGAEVVSDSYVRAVKPFNIGWNYYTIYNSTTGKAFYPASGRRNSSDGELIYVTNYGYYWSNASAITNSFYLYFTNSITNPQNTTYRAAGLSVRPCKEQ